MWKRIRESFKLEETCAGQYVKFDFAGLHISYDRMWWFMTKQRVKGDDAIQRMADEIVKKILADVEEL